MKNRRRRFEKLLPASATEKCTILVFALAIMILAQPVYASDTWLGHRPSSDSSNYSYIYRDHTPVFVNTTYKGTDASVELAVENYAYQQNYAGSGMDQYSLRLMAGANSRVAHTYIIARNSAPSQLCEFAGCVGSGFTTVNQGKWINLGFDYWFWGTHYTKVFLCENGWLAFQYSGDTNNCLAAPINLPAPDSATTDLPDGIIAPLWKPLDATPGSGTGTIKTYTSCYPQGSSPCTLQVTWNNVMTQGTATRCQGGPCTNTFSLNLDDQGNVFFGYGFVDSGDRYTGEIGLEDPSGYLAVLPSYSTTVANGVYLQDPLYLCCNLSDSKIVVDKMSATDQSTVGFQTDYVRGVNIKNSNPPPSNPSPNPVDETLAKIAEGAFYAGVCGVLGVEGAGCLVIGTGGIIVGGVVQYLFPQPSVPMYHCLPVVCSLGPADQTGNLEVPIQEPNSPRQTASDEMIFDVITWSVPHDSSLHNLKIQYQIQIGTRPWLSLSVLLTVDAGDFQISATQPSPSTVQQGSSASSTITINAINSLTASINLNASLSSVDPNRPMVTFNPSVLSFYQGGTASSIMTIQTNCNTPTSTYAIIASGTDSAGALTHSQTVMLTVTSYTCGGGSGGGSLARGTLITMADGSKKQVQAIRVGNQLLGYDPSTGRYGVATVEKTKTVVTSNELIISTVIGVSLKTDNSVTEVLWTKLTNGTALWLPVTLLSPGESLFTQNGWTEVTNIDYLDGSYVMYDLTASMPYFANGYLDPPHPS